MILVRMTQDSDLLVIITLVLVISQCESVMGYWNTLLTSERLLRWLDLIRTLKSLISCP